MERDDDLFDEEFAADFEDYTMRRSDLTLNELQAEKQFAANLLGVHLTDEEV